MKTYCWRCGAEIKECDTCKHCTDAGFTLPPDWMYEEYREKRIREERND